MSLECVDSLGTLMDNNLSLINTHLPLLIIASFILSVFYLTSGDGCPFNMPSKYSLVMSESPSQSELSLQSSCPHQTYLALEFDVSQRTSLLKQVDSPLETILPRDQTDPLHQQANLPDPHTNLSQQGQIDPPLIALPFEIKHHIFSYLKGPEPTLIILRRTRELISWTIPPLFVRIGSQGSFRPPESCLLFLPIS